MQVKKLHDARLFNHLTIAENVSLPARYHNDLHEDETAGWTQALLRATTTFDERAAAAEERFAASASEFAQARTALGSDSDAPMDRLSTILKSAGCVFLFAPRHHPSMPPPCGM